MLSKQKASLFFVKIVGTPRSKVYHILRILLKICDVYMHVHCLGWIDEDVKNIYQNPAKRTRTQQQNLL